MSWYDTFSRFYDRSLEPLYRAQRREAAEALDLAPGQLVVDLPCGTGLSFDTIAPAIGHGHGSPDDRPPPALLGVDLSAGMLSKARARADANGWSWVHLLERDVHQLDAAAVAEACGVDRDRPIDRIHVCLGLTAFPEWEAAFDRLWGLLAPGGRMAIVDVHAERPDFQGKMVNLVARADIRRRTWEPLERIASGYVYRELPSSKQHGGQLFLAVGDKA